MRISCDEKDSGYAYWNMARANGKVAHIFLNDKRIEKCVMADDELGVITRIKTDDSGNVVIAPDRESLERVTESGVVRIEWQPSK